MKTLVLFLAVVLFISCNKNKLGDCLEESSVKETSIYGTWLLKRISVTDDVTFDTKDVCYDNNGSIVTFTASNTFSWDRFSFGDALLHSCFQGIFAGTFELSKDAEDNYIEFSYKCDAADELQVLKRPYFFENQYLLISGIPCPCGFWYVRQS